MRITRRRHRPLPAEHEAEMQRAAAAVRESERALAATRGRTAEVHDLGKLLREMRAQNHFGARIVAMLREAEGDSHGHHD